MRPAMRSYLLQNLIMDDPWTSTMVLVAVVLAIGLLVFAREFDFLAGLFAGLLLAVATLLALAALSRWRTRAAGMTAANGRRGAFVLFDESLEVETEMFFVRYPWKTFRRIWKDKRAWLLEYAGSQGVLLPLAGVPAEALQFIEASIPQRRR